MPAEKINITPLNILRLRKLLKILKSVLVSHVALRFSPADYLSFVSTIISVSLPIVISSGYLQSVVRLVGTSILGIEHGRHVRCPARPQRWIEARRWSTRLWGV